MNIDMTSGATTSFARKDSILVFSHDFPKTQAGYLFSKEQAIEIMLV